MRLLPLEPSAHPSAWGEPSAFDLPQETLSTLHQRDGFSCRFCGDQCRNRQEVFFLDGDRRNHDPANLATACLLCAAVQTPMRRHATLEMTVIWLPEMSQRALNLLVRGLHATRLKHDLPPAPEDCPPRDSLTARRTAASFMALKVRHDDLWTRTGLHTPQELATLFLRCDSIGGRCPNGLRNGLRFLHRGRHLENGVDIYRALLAADLAAARPTEAA